MRAGQSLENERSFLKTPKPHAAFEENALFLLMQEAVQNVQTVDQEEYTLRELLRRALTKEEFEKIRITLLNAKAGNRITLGDKVYTLPAQWEPKKGIFSHYEGSPLHNLLCDFSNNNEIINDQLSSVIAIINKADDLLRENKIESDRHRVSLANDKIGLDVALLQVNQATFNQLLQLLSENTYTFEKKPFLDVSIWLRAHIVRLFCDIQKNDKNPHVFTNALEEIQDDAPGIKNNLCNDYIYRVFLQKIADAKVTDISSTYIENILLSGTSSELLQDMVLFFVSQEVPYFKTRYGEPCKMKMDNTVYARESPEQRNDRLRQERDDLINKVVISQLKTRITECGYLEKLENSSFDEFYALKYPSQAKAVARCAFKAMTQPKEVLPRDLREIVYGYITDSCMNDIESRSSDSDVPAVTPKEDEESVDPPEVVTPTTTQEFKAVPSETAKCEEPSKRLEPLVVQPDESKLEVLHASEEQQLFDKAKAPQKKPGPWKKMLIGAFIFGVIGAIVVAASPIVLGVAAIAVTVGIGMVVGALFGWVVHKLGECCYRPAKEPDSILSDRPEEQAFVLPRAGFNASLGLLYSSGKAPAPVVDMPAKPKKAPASSVASSHVAHEDTFLSPMFRGLR